MATFSEHLGQQIWASGFGGKAEPGSNRPEAATVCGDQFDVNSTAFIWVSDSTLTPMGSSSISFQKFRDHRGNMNQAVKLRICSEKYAVLAHLAMLQGLFFG